MRHLSSEEFSVAAPRKAADSSARRTSGNFGILAFIVVVSGILSLGWLYRNDPVIAPQNTFGYALGVVGGSMMLLVLLYPLRKRLKFMRNWARLAPWFRWHMVFGCLGPALVLVHANFGAQSLNGLMALTSTLIVASSGVIGRYLYVRVHKGLYGARLEARDLLSGAIAARPGAHRGVQNQIAGWEGALRAYEKKALAPASSLWAAIKKCTELAVETRRAQSAIVVEAFRVPLVAGGHLNRAALTATRTDLRRRVSVYFRALRRAGSLAVYERLFALWHVLHLPLIFLLILTAIVHVIAVHLY